MMLKWLKEKFAPKPKYELWLRDRYLGTFNTRKEASKYKYSLFLMAAKNQEGNDPKITIRRFIKFSLAFTIKEK